LIDFQRANSEHRRLDDMRETRGQSELSNAELRVRYAEARERLKQAQQRILELERLLMRTVAQQRTEAQGQPLLDLAEGHAPTSPAAEEEDEDDEPVFPPRPPKKSRRGRRKFPAHLPRTIKAYDVQPERDLPDYDPTKGFTIVDYDTCEELQMPRPQPSVTSGRWCCTRRWMARRDWRP
jgi:hypothetical protein